MLPYDGLALYQMDFQEMTNLGVGGWGGDIRGDMLCGVKRYALSNRGQVNIEVVKFENSTYCHIYNFQTQSARLTRPVCQPDPTGLPDRLNSLPDPLAYGRIQIVQVKCEHDHRKTHATHMMAYMHQCKSISMNMYQNKSMKMNMSTMQ
jgi:hypothetical protein